MKYLISVLSALIVCFLNIADANTLPSHPTFSIIVSCYNYGHFVGKTIQSVLDSDYPDFELILINDGSTDNSLQVMQDFAKKDSRIKIINQENQGLSNARNNGIKIAIGNFLWFVDADDYIDKTALTQLSKKIPPPHTKTSQQIDMITFFLQPIDENDNILEPDNYKLLPRWVAQKPVYHGQQLSWKQQKYLPVVSSKTIYRRAFVDTNHLTFSPNQIFEDDIFFHTALRANATLTALPSFLLYKRVHSDSITQNRPKYYDSIVRLPMLIYNSVKSVGADEEFSRQVFDWYLGAVFSKYPNNPKFIPDLQKLSNWIDAQPNDDGFWAPHSTKLKQFIIEKSANIEQ